jgi:hypothetical protein
MKEPLVAVFIEHNDKKTGLLEMVRDRDSIANILKSAIRKRKEHGMETCVLLLDLVKALDRVPSPEGVAVVGDGAV